MQQLLEEGNAATERGDFISAGNAFFKAGQMDRAAASYQGAVTADPQSARARVLLAHALTRMGQAEEAEVCLRQAISLEPGYAAAYDLLGFLLPQVGRFSEARECALRATTLDPGNAAYFVRYVYAGKVTRSDEEIVERLLAVAPSLSGQDRIRVEYGLGKALEDLERYEESLFHYREANSRSAHELDGNRPPFDPDMHRQEIEMLIQAFSKPRLESLASTGSESELPVFIVGMMRSGTTLTEQILSCHPEVKGAGELDFWIQAGPRTFNAPPAYLASAANKYLEMLTALGPGKRRVCDKMPQNYMNLGSIHAAFPKARIIHCRRDPKDTSISLYTIPFTHHPPFAYSLKNIGFTYRQYLRIMEHWRTVLPADRFMDVDYEELVADQKAVARRMISFLGLEWNDACLRPELNERVVNTPSRWQVRQPVYGTSVGRWKRFAPWLGSMLEEWKYIP